MLQIVNQARRQKEIADLKMDEELQEAAMQRAAEIAMYYGHTRPDGSSETVSVDIFNSNEEFQRSKARVCLSNFNVISSLDATAQVQTDGSIIIKDPGKAVITATHTIHYFLIVNDCFQYNISKRRRRNAGIKQGRKSAEIFRYGRKIR